MGCGVRGLDQVSAVRESCLIESPGKTRRTDERVVVGHAPPDRPAFRLTAAPRCPRRLTTTRPSVHRSPPPPPPPSPSPRDPIGMSALGRGARGRLWAPDGRCAGRSVVEPCPRWRAAARVHPRKRQGSRNSPVQAPTRLSTPPPPVATLQTSPPHHRCPRHPRPGSPPASPAPARVDERKAPLCDRPGATVTQQSRPPQGEAPGEVSGASGVLPPRTLGPAWPEVSARRWLERLGGGDTGSTARPSRVGGRCGPELRSAPDRTWVSSGTEECHGPSSATPGREETPGRSGRV